MIERDNNLLNISWLCETAGVSRSGYYRWINTIDTRNIAEERDKKDFELFYKRIAFVVMIRVHAESICVF